MPNKNTLSLEEQLLIVIAKNSTHNLTEVKHVYNTVRSIDAVLFIIHIADVLLMDLTKVVRLLKFKEVK